MAYCSVSDVSLRLGLDSAQRTRASSRIESAIRRAAIHIDSVFRDFGRDSPGGTIVETTLSSPIDISTDKYTGISGDFLTGVNGLDYDHASGSTVRFGEFAHIMLEVAADIAAGLYFQDEAVFSSESEMRSPMFMARGNELLYRYARLGSVD